MQGGEAIPGAGDDGGALSRAWSIRLRHQSSRPRKRLVRHSATFGEIVGDESTLSPLEGLHEKNLNQDLAEMVNSLDEREAEIIKLRFGLEGRDELTLEEVGKRFHVTRERIRQLEYLALNKMRRAMAKRESIRTSDEIEQEHRQRERMAVIREFVESKSRRPATLGRN